MICRFKPTLTKIPSGFNYCLEISNLILKSYANARNLDHQCNLKENTVGGFTLPDCRTYLITLIKII